MRRRGLGGSPSEVVASDPSSDLSVTPPNRPAESAHHGKITGPLSRTRPLAQFILQTSKPPGLGSNRAIASGCQCRGTRGAVACRPGRVQTVSREPRPGGRLRRPGPTRTSGDPGGTHARSRSRSGIAGIRRLGLPSERSARGRGASLPPRSRCPIIACRQAHSAASKKRGRSLTSP